MDQTILLQQDAPATERSFHPVVKAIAKVVSYIFHPLFIPVYISWFLIYVDPVFPALDADGKAKLLIRFFIMYTMFPLVTILLAKGLGFVQSIYLKTQKDRIIPYVACGIYYFWMWYVLRNQPEIPDPFIQLSLGIFIASSLGLMANSYFKVSMHAISVGVMAAFILQLGLSTNFNLGSYISVALFVTGLVCTARLITDDHIPFEIYAGLFIGIIAQVAAYLIV